MLIHAAGGLGISATEEAFGLVEDQDRLHGTCLGKDLLNVLTCLPHILIHDIGRVHHLQGPTNLEANGLSRQRFSGARRSIKEDTGPDLGLPTAEGGSATEAPLAIKHRLGLLEVDDFLQFFPQLWHTDQDLQAAAWHDAALEATHGQAAAQLQLGAPRQVVLGNSNLGFSIASTHLFRTGASDAESCEDGILDEAARQLVAHREGSKVDIPRQRQSGGDQRGPNMPSQNMVWFLKLNCQGNASMHCFVQIKGSIRGQDDHAIVAFDLCQQHVHIALVRLVTGLKNGFAFIKEEHRVVDLRLPEDHADEACGLLPAEGREVDQQQLFPQEVCNGIGCHGLPRARVSVEKHHQTAGGNGFIQLELMFALLEQRQTLHSF
mmetsp:Transcript_13989/g.30954  ORF Transcript_13989/g.30954 Transcript_13989/m.30954 type:complete len:378 (+) Transcript_13989:416-1549(+)